MKKCHETNLHEKYKILNAKVRKTKIICLFTITDFYDVISVLEFGVNLWTKAKTFPALRTHTLTMSRCAAQCVVCSAAVVVCLFVCLSQVVILSKRSAGVPGPRGYKITNLLLLLPFINTVDKTQLHTQNGNSRSHKIQQSVFTHYSLSLNNLVCYS